MNVKGVLYLVSFSFLYNQSYFFGLFLMDRSGSETMFISNVVVRDKRSDPKSLPLNLEDSSVGFVMQALQIALFRHKKILVDNYSFA